MKEQEDESSVIDAGRKRCLGRRKCGNLAWRGFSLRAYLIRVHFKLSHDLDGNLVAGLGVAGLVDVAEGSVAHLFYQDVSFQTGVPRQLAGLFSFFGD